MDVKTAKSHLRMLGFELGLARNHSLFIRTSDNIRLLHYSNINFWDISPISENKPFAVKLVGILNEPTNRKGAP